METEQDRSGGASRIGASQAKGVGRPRPILDAFRPNHTAL